MKYRDFALQNGLRAAWSTPIMSHDGKVLGTFCMYYREVRHPGPGEIQLIAPKLLMQSGIGDQADRSSQYGNAVPEKDHLQRIEHRIAGQGLREGWWYWKRFQVE